MGIRVPANLRWRRNIDCIEHRVAVHAVSGSNPTVREISRSTLEHAGSNPFHSQQPDFHSLRQARVGKKRGQQDGPV